MNAVQLVLASSSPRRKELLAAMGLRFSIEHADIDESPLPGERVEDTALRLALGKAREVAKRRPDALILGADTLVALDGVMMGKPKDEAGAAAMLHALSGRTHDVFTAVSFSYVPERLEESLLCRSCVTFKNPGAAAIAAYVATGEPMGKAGAYAIQGHGLSLIESYYGSHSNIVGLPAREVLRFFMSFGTDRLPWVD